MSTRRRKVEDAKNDNEESTPKRSTLDVSLSQPDIDEKAPVDSLPSTQENNVSSDGSLSYSVEDIWQKLKELGLPEAANKFRGKKNTLVNLILVWFMVFNVTFNNISVISWRLLIWKTRTKHTIALQCFII